MNNRLKSFIMLLILIILILFLYKKKEKLSEFVINDYSFGIAQITRAYVLGGAEVWMDYKYIVDSVKYENTFTPESFTYYDCYKDFDLCDTLEFWIIYSNLDPKKSMIDLTAPIMKGEDPKFTRNLNDFEY